MDEVTIIQFIGIAAGGMAIISIIKMFLPILLKNKEKKEDK